MTRLQVRWASQHDWFISSKWRGNGYEVTVQGHTPDFRGGWIESKPTFTNIERLKQWAGY